ncbi:MAG TPA: DUF2125 domain-containing protein [Stellaceae bacterium]|jgi:hypothetical protein|nr:DUF2125 domain-containing protein [Stellaceae bacterium]
MRRSTVFRVLGGLLVLGIGVYTAFWWIAAGRIQSEAATWREAARQQGIEASWQGMRVTGYPLSFRLELTDAAVKDNASATPADLQAPLLMASIHPWDFHTAWVVAPQGLGIALGPNAWAKLSAESGSGAVALSDDKTTIWLSLYKPTLSGMVNVTARAVHLWSTVPAVMPTAHQEAGIAVALDVHELVPPVLPPGFTGAIDDLGFGLTMRGAFPSGPLRPAAAAWRDSGGTVELDHLHLRWGETEITGSGTLALDGNLQPIGGFSGGVSGFEQLLSALVASGRIKASDARIARLALAMLAKAGPDGRPEISTSFSIQDGQMYLGPAKLGPAPRIDW